MPLVLLIDDEEGMVDLVRMAIDRPEMRIARAATLEEALAAIEAEPPDVVLLDLALRPSDGLDLLPRLRAAGLEHVPVIAFTVHGSREREALQRGVDGFVAKPFQVRDLREAVERHLP